MARSASAIRFGWLKSGLKKIETQQRTIDQTPERALRNLNIDAGSTFARRKIDDIIADETQTAVT